LFWASKAKYSMIVPISSRIEMAADLLDRTS
jgi:hypothetical protein